MSSDLGALYPDSKRLQQAIQEYTIVLIGLCGEVVKFLAKNAASQMVSVAFKPFNNSVFAEYQTNLESQLQCIRDEVLCASSALQHQTFDETSSSRKLLSKVSDSQARDLRNKELTRQRKRRARFLDSCSTYDYQYDLRQFKGRGHATWFSTNPAYQAWMTSKGILWCSGILGSGKSVLMANIIQELMITYLEAAVAYFFCRYDRLESLSAETVICSLARQIFQANNYNTAEEATKDHDKVEQITALLERLPSTLKDSIIIVDGLDECDDAVIRTILIFVSRIRKTFQGFRFCCSTRTEVTAWASRLINPDYTLHMSDSGTAMDDYISDALLDCLDTGRLSVGREDLIITIHDTLLECAKGM